MTNLEVSLFSSTIIIHTAIYIFFVIAPFINKLRFGLKTTIAIVLVYTLVSDWMFSIGYNTPSLTPMFELIPLIAWVALTLAGCFICIKTNPLELLFSILVILNMQANVVVFANAFRVVIIGRYFPSLQFKGDGYIYPLIILVFIFSPMMWFLFIRIFKKVVKMKIDFHYWRYLWVIPLLFYINLYVSGFGGIGKSGAYTMADFINLILMNTVSYASYIVCLQMLVKTHRSLKSSEEMHVMAKQLEMQKNQYEQLSESISKIELVRHDLKQHFLAIAGYAKRGECDEITRYIESCGDYYFVGGTSGICANHALDIILCHYLAIAEEKKIETKVSVNVPENLPIQSTNLCIVFGNLIENAIEACLRQSNDDAKRFIEIRTVLKGKQLILLVKNSFDGPVNSNGLVFFSSKRKGNEEGIGISSVRSIVDKNGGTLIIDSSNNVFSVKAIINF